MPYTVLLSSTFTPIFYQLFIFSKVFNARLLCNVCLRAHRNCLVVVLHRGRPSRNAANTFPDFSAGLSQNSVIVKKNQQLVEKHEKLTICKGNSAPFRLFLLKIVLKFICRFLL
jgi:hypothetical protein